ncbi:hypothetical protein [Paenibacillus sp. FSL R10-2771]|uniref:hypothetical protein n=1 Tax=Paenibacillus sp. FSL R10-2771 TaxID=2954693 RepID=UPI0030F5275D
MNESFLVSAIKAFFQNSPLAMFYIVLSLVAIWMYKQFRAYLIENQKSTIGKTEKAIEVYSELEVTIRKILQGNIISTSLDECITKSSSYLPYELLKKYYNRMETEEEVEGDRNRKLKELHQKVKYIIPGCCTAIEYWHNKPVAGLSYTLFGDDQPVCRREISHGRYSSRCCLNLRSR